MQRLFADGEGIPTFEMLHSRCNDHLAFACAFDLLMLGGEDLRHLPFAKRKAALRKLLKADRGGIQYVEHAKASCRRNSTHRIDRGNQNPGSKSRIPRHRLPPVR